MAKYDAGVKEYRDIYWAPDYVPLDTDLLACFKVVGQEGVPREEVAAAVAAESSTGTWSTVWSELLTDLEFYKGRAYRIEDVPGDKDAFYTFIAYPLDLFEEGSVVNVLTSLVGNVFGFKALRSLRLEDMRFPIAFIKTCGGPPAGIQLERDRLNKYGRPMLGCTIKPKLGLSAKNYGRSVYECLRGGLDLTKDDENINSQPFMRWRDRWDFVADAIDKAERETGERKGHYLNVTAPTSDEMMKRAEYAKELGQPIIMHDFLTGGFTANTGLANWCRENGMLLHIHRAMHAVLDRNPHHGIHFRVLTKILRLSEDLPVVVEIIDSREKISDNNIKADMTSLMTTLNSKEQESLRGRMHDLKVMRERFQHDASMENLEHLNRVESEIQDRMHELKLQRLKSEASLEEAQLKAEDWGIVF